MLKLTRAVGESIIIGDDVEIRVTRTDRGLVELQIEYPLDVAIRVPASPLYRPFNDRATDLAPR